jgi:hypothetical protein
MPICAVCFAPFDREEAAEEHNLEFNLMDYWSDVTLGLGPGEELCGEDAIAWRHVREKK